MKFTFPWPILITDQVLKEKWFENDGFCPFTNKLVNKAANDSARVSGHDCKIQPALGTNQIAGFAGFPPLASFEKNKYIYFTLPF